MSRVSGRFCDFRKGFTIVEVLATIAVISLLMALLVPAVQSAREGARRSACVSHMRQISFAIANYCEAFGVFPGAEGGGVFWHPKIKGFLEIGLDETRSAVFACPSDPLSLGDWKLNNQSYYGNNGVYRANPGDGFLGFRNVWIGPRDVSDGLSNTAAFSERLAFPSEKELWQIDLDSPSEAILKRLFRFTSAPLESTSAFADECEFRAVDIYRAWFADAYYTHIVSPNRPTCTNGPDLFRQPYAVTAASEHPQGVNVAFGDGAARLVSNSISREVWWALGTRNGNETLSSPTF